MAELYTKAKDVRKSILDLVLNEGACPSTQDLTKMHGLAPEELRQVFRDLEAGIVIAVQRKSHAGITHFMEKKLEASALSQPPCAGSFFLGDTWHDQEMA